MNVIHVNFNDLEDFRDYTQKKIEEIQDALYLILKEYINLEWEGTAHDQFVNHFNARYEKIEQIPEILDKFIKIMNQVYNDYKEGEDDVRDKFKKLVDVIEEQERIWR